MIRVLIVAVLTVAGFGSLACGAQTAERSSIAKPDRYTIGESDTDVVLNVLSNDEGADSPRVLLQIVDVGPTSDGGTVVNLGSCLTYTPPTDFAGIDSFSYTAAGSDGSESTADVSIAVSNGIMTWRIMPLGGSITEGENPYNSFRRELWHSLTDAGFDIDMVGSKSGNRDGQVPDPDFDTDHEGHWGWRVDEFLLNSRITDWALIHQPDAVFIHLGTNDMAQGQSVSGTIAEIGQIIDDLRGVNPEVIVVAQLIPANRSWAPRLVDLNKEIPILTASKNTAQSPVVAVDQANGFDPAADTYDGIHPNLAGETKMAAKWYDVLAPLINEAPLLEQAVPDSNATVGQVFTLNTSIYMSDPEGGSLSFMVNVVPAGLSFDNTTGILSEMPTSAGSTAILLTGADIFGLSVQDSFTITINDPLVTGKKGGGGSLNGLVNRLFVLLLFVLAGIRRYNAFARA